jgi:hypothetical protein
MENYSEYLDELMSAPIFLGIGRDSLLELLEALGPRIVRFRAGDCLRPPEPGCFYLTARSNPPRNPEKRRFKYAMPKFGEPGMMMAEIPALSQFAEALDRPPGNPHPSRPLEFDLDCLLFSAEMAAGVYDPKAARIQSIMMRNFLGILAQKVMDVRQELFLVRDGTDIYNL